jgi:hypothetical protein
MYVPVLCIWSSATLSSMTSIILCDWLVAIRCVVHGAVCCP